MAEERKPGLLKRIFSFGFGKKKAEPERDDTAAQEQEVAARLEAEAEARAEAQKQKAAAEKQAKEKAEREAAEKEAKEKAKQAEAAAKREAQEAKAKADQEAAEKAKREAEAAEKKAEEEAEAKAAAAALEAERAQREAEERALREAEAAQAAKQEAEAKLEAERKKAKQEPEPEPVTAAEPEQPQEEPVDEETERKDGWFKRLRNGLARSSNTLTENITSVFTKKKLDDDTLQDLEDILIQADLGVETAMNITDALASQRMGKDVTDEEVRQVMADEITKVLEPVAQPLELDLDHQPHVILVVGVNGSGKTTTIGKISQKLYNAGFSTLLVAGDTFRAAAVEQLHIWGDRTQAPVMSRDNGADAAGLAFDAYTEAQSLKKDVMLMDTAGRLQNKKELMDELEKIIRVLKKQDPTAPHTVLLTLDATTGQNALNQVEIFKDVAGVNGLVMTKLDGTARGGILVAISAKHKLPVYFIGVGEQVEDLEPFEAHVFAKTIAGLDTQEND